jgi:hypothetical protein
MSQNIQHTGLNEVQIGLLRMFDRNIPENDIQEIKQVLVKHLSKQLLDEVSRVVEEKGITEEDFKRLGELFYIDWKSIYGNLYSQDKIQVTEQAILC